MSVPVALPHPAQPTAGWAPSSPCGPGCLQDDDGDPASGLRMAARLVRLVGLLLVAVLVGAVLAVPLLRGPVRGHALRAGCRAALRAVGVRLRVNDAKQELRDWPVIGGLAARTGALFVDRAGLRSLPATVAATTQALRSGAVVGVFPEGTTWCGAAAGTFRRAAFQAAVDAGAPVRPVAIELRRPDGSQDRSSAFVGDQTLWDSLSRVLRLPALACELTVLPVIPPGAAADRRELARLAAEAVGAHTGVTHSHARYHPSCAAAPVAA
jgi:1-acyl-sn-glycerol-3-phosphate acyltransferase